MHLLTLDTQRKVIIIMIINNLINVGLKSTFS